MEKGKENGGFPFPISGSKQREVGNEFFPTSLQPNTPEKKVRGRERGERKRKRKFINKETGFGTKKRVTKYH